MYDVRRGVLGLEVTCNQLVRHLSGREMRENGGLLEAYCSLEQHRRADQGFSLLVFHDLLGLILELFPVLIEPIFHFRDLSQQFTSAVALRPRTQGAKTYVAKNGIPMPVRGVHLPIVVYLHDTHIF